MNVVLTSLIEMERIWSTLAVTLRTDDAVSDIPDGSMLSAADMVNDSILQGSDTVLMYLDKWYDQSALATSNLPRRWATYCACYFLSLRRGNPAQYSSMYEQVMGLLQKVWEGLLQIPGLVTKFDMTPAMSNYRIDDRFFLDKIRVQDFISRGGTYATESLDPTVPYTWY